MFVFTSKMKLLAGSLTLVGLVFLLIGFNTDYSSHAAEGHAEATSVAAHADDHAEVAHAGEAAPATEEAPAIAVAHSEEAVAVDMADEATHTESAHAEGVHAEGDHVVEGVATDHAAEGSEAHPAEGHDEHAAEGHGASHDLSANRPWAAFLVNSIFFLGIGIGTLFFLAIQYAAQVGWSAGLIRVFEAVSMFVGIPLLGILFLAVTGGMHMHHLWHWMAEGIMDPASANYDPIIAGIA